MRKRKMKQHFTMIFCTYSAMLKSLTNINLNNFRL